MKRSHIRPSTKPMKRSRLRRVGKKTKAWNDARAELKVEFEYVYGITTCELRYKNCANDDYLGFAHAAKRRKLTPDDLKHVILACNFCHDELEVLLPEEMKRIVDTICQQRESMLISHQSSAL